MHVSPSAQLPSSLSQPGSPPCYVAVQLQLLIQPLCREVPRQLSPRTCNFLKQTGVTCASSASGQYIAESGSMQQSGWLEHWTPTSRIVQGGPEITEAEDQEDYKAEDDDAESEDLEVGCLPGLRRTWPSCGLQWVADGVGDCLCWLRLAEECFTPQLRQLRCFTLSSCRRGGSRPCVGT